MPTTLPTKVGSPVRPAKHPLLPHCATRYARRASGLESGLFLRWLGHRARGSGARPTYRRLRGDHGCGFVGKEDVGLLGVNVLHGTFFGALECGGEVVHVLLQVAFCPA